MRTLLLAICYSLVCCTSGPFLVKTPSGGMYAGTGVSIFTKSASETASLTLADGTTMTHTVNGKDETRVPAIMANAAISAHGATALGTGIKAIK